VPVILGMVIDGETKLCRAGYAMVQRIKLLPKIVFLDYCPGENPPALPGWLSKFDISGSMFFAI
jgi:hypothetical protein